MTIVAKNSARLALLSATASLAFVASAMAQDDAATAPPVRERFVTHQWSLNTSLFYTDNFRRLNDKAVRFETSEPFSIGTNPFTGEDLSIPLTTTRDVSIDPPDNFIASATFSGSTLVRRPKLSGLISGSVTFGAYLDTDDVDQRALSSATPPVPAIADFADPLNPGATVNLPVASASFGLRNRSTTFLDPNFRAVGSAQIIENLLYLDVNGLIQEQNLGFGGLAVQQGVGQAGDEIVYGGLSVSPYLFRQFGNEGTLEARVRGTAIQVLKENIDFSATGRFGPDDEASLRGAQFENDSRSAEGLVEYQSGKLFDRFSFKLGAFLRQVVEDGSDLENVREVNFKQASGSADIAYGINRSLSLTAGVGHDDVKFKDLVPLSPDNPPGATAAEIAALDAARQARLDEIADQKRQEDDLTGVFWKVGFRYTPTRRSELGVSIGERYGGTLVQVDGKFRPSKRVTLTVGADRQLNSGLQDFASSAFQLQGQAFGLLTSLAEGQSSAAATLLNRALSFEGSSFRDAQRGQFGFSAINRVRAGVTGNFRRTTAALGVEYAETGRNGRDSDLWSANASLERQLTRRLSANARMSYSLDDGSFLISDLVQADPAVEPQLFKTTQSYASLGFAYQLGQRLALTGQAYRVDSGSDGATRGTQLDYIENAAGIGLRWVF
ncbi:MAG: hypothetical protein ACWA5T_07745 [Parvularcula sp.]